MILTEAKLITGLWFDRGDLSPDLTRAFEAYGHAMACAAALELQIALSLIKLKTNKQRVQSVETSSLDDLFRHANRLRKLTLSKLIPMASRDFKLSNQLREALDLAKRARDNLAHNFWDSNLGMVHSQRGIDLIVKSCSIEAWHFHNVSKDFEREVGFSVMDYFEITRNNSEIAEDGLEAVISDHL